MTDHIYAYSDGEWQTVLTWCRQMMTGPDDQQRLQALESWAHQPERIAMVLRFFHITAMLATIRNERDHLRALQLQTRQNTQQILEVIPATSPAASKHIVEILCNRDLYKNMESIDAALDDCLRVADETTAQLLALGRSNDTAIAVERSL